MNVFVDGFQNTGKTTLLEKSKYKCNRFPFNQYLDEFNLTSKEELNGFQIAKDLGILFGLSFSRSQETILFDRGPFSTLYYSLKDNRWSKNIDNYKNFAKEISKFRNMIYIFVIKINNYNENERSHNDGFDYLQDDGDPNKFRYLEMIQSFARSAGIELYIFENDYSKSIEENVEKFDNYVGGLVREYNRNKVKEHY